MPIKMRALQRHYVIAEKHEYNAGDAFEVATEQEADMLVRSRRAERLTTEEAKPHAEKRHYGRRDMKPEA